MKFYLKNYKIEEFSYKKNVRALRMSTSQIETFWSSKI